MAYQLYRTPTPLALSQGDILDPAPLRDNLKGHQEHFTKTHFYRYIIATQTCDLARTDKRESSEFIALCVVRRFDEALGWRHVENDRARNSTESLLALVLNHNYNKRGFFYLPKEPSYGIEEDCVADLRVMFSLHRVQYEDLLAARCGAITEVYAAQLGHMIGYMFSRVATPGWEDLYPEQSLKAKVQTMRGDIQTRERRSLDALMAEFGDECAMEGCTAKAETFRWVRVRRDEYQDTTKHEAHLLCRAHAAQHDQGTVEKASIRHGPLNGLVS